MKATKKLKSFLASASLPGALPPDVMVARDGTPTILCFDRATAKVLQEERSLIERMSGGAFHLLYVSA